MFVKTKKKTQVKKTGLLARVAKLTYDSMVGTAPSVAEGSSEEEESADEGEVEVTNCLPEEEGEDDRLPPSDQSSGCSTAAEHGSVVDADFDGPRGEPKSLAPK